MKYMNTIIKPITLMREDFANKIVVLCNDSGLPYFCIESILKDIIQEVHQASIKQYESDKIRYENELKAKAESEVEPE